MFKKIVRSVALIVAAFSLFGLCSCFGHDGEIDFGEKGNDGLGEKAVANTSGITSFRYSYNGSIGADSYSVTVKKDGDAAIVTFEGMQYDAYGEMTSSEDVSLLAELEKMYNDCKLYQWEGYDKYNPMVLDGDGFSLSIGFADGKSMSCGGSNAYPDGYRDFSNKREEILRPIIDRIIEERKQELIAEGISGDLYCFMTNFQQQGDSGSDHYDFFITDSETRDQNFDVTIHSESGEFIEPGDYRYYCALPEEAIDFAAVQALIEKYNVISWYDWDEAAEDYNNSEWFQVSFSFEGTHISAMGTDYPENYEEFRREFISTVISIIKNAEENYGLTQYE